jgi:DNA-binding transcriptional MerR regulator/methylmalonyl-CoA mutase cobalamin-binding subunit
MTSLNLNPGVEFSIADVERDTGLSKDVLRVWERRYGFPVPTRNALGERVYDEAQLNRLRHIRRLLDAGYRPARIVQLPLNTLMSLQQQSAQPAATADSPTRIDEEYWLSFLYAQDGSGLREALVRTEQSLGLMGFLSDVVAPLNRLVGQAWLEGRLAIHEEHLYTHAVSTVMRQALWIIRENSHSAGPRVLTTTLPGEEHGLGVLMAECAMAYAGCTLQSLGLQTPVPDIIAAVQGGQVDVVALGFSGAQNPRDAFAALQQLRELLDPRIEIWVGGTNAALQRLIQGAQRGHEPALYMNMTHLGDIPPHVDRWRADHRP